MDFHAGSDIEGDRNWGQRQVARPKQSYLVRSVEKALQLLQALASEGTAPLGVTELARMLGFNKNQVFRLLKTLEHYECVEQDASTGRYRLGIGIFSLAAQAHKGVSLVGAASPIVDRLARKTGETIHLIAHHRLEAVVVDVRESSQPIRLTATFGGRFPLHAGACPRAILAHLPSKLQAEVFRQLSGLPQYTDRTVMDPEHLRKEIEQVQRLGYAVSDGDVDSGARSAGAAILDRSGFPVGAVSIAGPMARVSVSALEGFGQLAREAALEIAVRLRTAGVQVRN